MFTAGPQIPPPVPIIQVVAPGVIAPAPVIGGVAAAAANAAVALCCWRWSTSKTSAPPTSNDCWKKNKEIRYIDYLMLVFFII